MAIIPMQCKQMSFKRFIKGTSCQTAVLHLALNAEKVMGGGDKAPGGGGSTPTRWCQFQPDSLSPKPH